MMYGHDDAVLINNLGCHNTTYPASSLRAAHRTMQVHLECRVGECSAKTAAHTTLQDAGRLIPDSSRVRE
ncbi:hypothetical protein [Nocardia sp. NPDC050793]|uniref:hypothetical protein n=1 Tax=Nocardia sp. NPDC050793 TaxID=3155159 RepID=UPI0033FEE7DF